MSRAPARDISTRITGLLASCFPMARKRRRRMMAIPSEIGLRRSLAVHSHTLDNGLKVLLVENPSIPNISMTGSVLAGARFDPEAKAGLAIMVSRLLDEGTQNRISLEIADAIESVGGSIETDGSFERIIATVSALSKDIDLSLELLSDLLIRPVFPQAYVDKEKERTLAEIVSAKDRPQVIAGWQFNELIYQDHPLHRPSHGYPETVEALTREDLLEFHERYFVPNNVILSIVGDFRVPELLPKIEQFFGNWKAKPISFPTYPAPERQTSKRVKFLT